MDGTSPYVMNLAADIRRALTPMAEVVAGVQLEGQASGRLRAADIAVRQQVGQFPLLAVLACPEGVQPVGMAEVKALAELARDVRANKAALLAPAGVDKEARALAAELGIDLPDKARQDWRAYLTIPMLFDLRSIARYQFAFSSWPVAEGRQDPTEITIFGGSRQPLGTAVAVLRAAWEAGRLPTEPGTHLDVVLSESALVRDGDDFHPTRFLANIEVKRKRFLGQLAPGGAQDLLAECQGGQLKSGFTAEWLVKNGVERKWRALDEETELAITPLLTLVAMGSFAA